MEWLIKLACMRARRREAVITLNHKVVSHDAYNVIQQQRQQRPQRRLVKRFTQENFGVQFNGPTLGMVAPLFGMPTNSRL